MNQALKFLAGLVTGYVILQYGYILGYNRAQREGLKGATSIPADSELGKMIIQGMQVQGGMQNPAKVEPEAGFGVYL